MNPVRSATLDESAGYAALLEDAWRAVVKYRHAVHDTSTTGTWRAHLVDLDLFGVLQELHEDGVLRGFPTQVMARILHEDLQVELAMPLTDPPQEIYDACIELLTRIGAIREGGWRDTPDG